ncbi:MAG TPA: hypothetical protein VJ596_03220 [Gemmatimonadaceae bacterium]|nr:hypothetical protein [Gemmatimonadaceae bacterium]
MPDSNGRRAAHLLVDVHVHFHPGYDPAAFFRAAHVNFAAAATSFAITAWRGVLCFTESAGAHYFRSFREAGAVAGGAWRFEPTAEDISVVAHGPGGEQLVVVAGRQMVTREGLEVLALGTAAELPDGLQLEEAVHLCLSQDVVPVVPWGFGKWWFARGLQLAALLRSSVGPQVFLGDNGGRLRFASAPRHFALARALKRPILRGSDPLPFPDEVVRPGRYGVVLEGPVDLTRPGASLKALLRGLATQPPAFGQRVGLAAFTRAQIVMQWQKRTRSRA